MGKVTFSQTAFTSGVLSPKVMGRTDMDRYAYGLKDALNAHPVIHGGVSRRAGSMYLDDASTATAGASILIPFIIGRALAFQVEFSHLAMRVYASDGVDTGVALASPYSAADLAGLDWAQSDSTLYLFSGTHPPCILRRYNSGRWILAQAPFTQLPFAEVGHLGATALTLSDASAGAGRTATAGAAAFLASDVGRQITQDGALATVTAYTDATHVTVTIDRAFESTSVPPGAWTLESSPAAMMHCTAGAVGASVVLNASMERAAKITLASKTGMFSVTANAAVFDAGDVGKTLYAGGGVAEVSIYTDSTHITVITSTDFTDTAFEAGTWGLTADAFRASDVGSMVRINSGLVRIESVSSASTASAKVVREITAAVVAPALSWSLEAPAWSAAFGYPRTGTVYQQRMVCAGNAKFPRTVWGSRTGEPLDFSLWTNDSDAFAFTVDGDECSPISYISASTDLMVLTESAEYSMRGGVEKPITPTNVRIKPESTHGCAAVRPATINREVIFVQRSGRKVRGLGYRYDIDGYGCPDLTALAEHITAVPGVRWLAYQQEPNQLLWAGLADGRLASCTIDRDQQPSVIAWAPHDLGGFVEWGACIPHDDRDWLWVIVRRTINGATVRYIERLDDTFQPIHPSSGVGTVYGCTVDAGVVFDNAGGQSAFSVPHLASQEVDIVADGSKMPRQTVAADGTLSISRAAKRTLIGRPFRSFATLLTPEAATAEGSAQGQRTRTSTCVMRFLDTIGAKVVSSQGNEQPIPFRRFGVGVLDQAPQPYTGNLPVTLLGWERGIAELSIVQDDPMPMHLLSVVRTHTVNAS